MNSTPLSVLNALRARVGKPPIVAAPRDPQKLTFEEIAERLGYKRPEDEKNDDQ